MDHPFTIGFLDHVAIRVKDIEQSAEWYTRVLGLRKLQFPEWGPYPIFMVKDNFGIALFPANPADPLHDQASRNVKIDHFAFNISRQDFEKARNHYLDTGLDFQFQDHHYFHSIYTKDPDGHTVELTTQVIVNPGV